MGKASEGFSWQRPALSKGSRDLAVMSFQDAKEIFDRAMRKQEELLVQLNELRRSQNQPEIREWSSKDNPYSSVFKMLIQKKIKRWVEVTDPAKLHGRSLRPKSEYLAFLKRMTWRVIWICSLSKTWSGASSVGAQAARQIRMPSGSL
jgi:DNA-binding protein H-NS